jgi:hypothetical protein
LNNQSEDRVLGYVGTYPVGDYNEQTEYEYLNVVTHKGSSYVCIKEEGCTAIEPPNEECWQLFAGKGDTGEKGEKGDIGPTGPKPVNGVDYNTNAEREEFKNAVVADSKADLEKYITEKETQLDNYTKDKETKLDDYVTDTVKPTIDTYVTDTTKKDIDAYEKEKEKVLDTYTDTKKTEIDNYVTNTSKPVLDQYEKDKEAELETAKNTAINEYDAHAESILTETEDLFNALPTEKVNGTELYIEDAKPCRVINTEIGGMYKQNRTKGLNFFDITGYTDRTVNGINIKVNDDGTLTLNGVCTVEKTFVNISIPEHIIPAGTYTRYMSYAENIKSFLTLALSYNNTTIPNTSVQPNNQYTTSTYNDDITYNQIKLYIPNTNVTFNNIIVDPMLVRGEYTANNAPKYEPYTGGNPSPNPDYPQAIEQVESVKLNIRGKNLCDGINQNYYLTNNVDICGKVTGNSGLAIDVQDKSYVTISTKITQDRYRIACTNSLLQEEKATTVAYRGVQKDNTSATVTINTTGYKYLIINATDLSSILVENGSVATEYEPYQNQAINIDLKGNKLCAISNTIKGKLLIDKNGNVALQKNVDKISTNESTFTLKKATEAAEGYSAFYSIGFYNIIKMNGGLLCNYFQYAPYDENGFKIRTSEEMISDGGGYRRIYFRVKTERLETDDESGYKKFLTDNNIIIYHSLETSELIDLGQIPELPKTFEGINNIWAETNLGNTEIEIEYVQDVKKLLEQQNARLDNIEALLSTTETSALLLDNMQTDLESEVK